jgi:RimJ/RimL family protein N-acetyltransferase
MAEPTVGATVDWTPAERPARVTLEGRTVRVEPLEVKRHGNDLWEAAQGANADPLLWAYLGYGPFEDEAAFRAHLAAQEASPDPLFFTGVDQASGEALGVASLMRIDATNGVGEVGHIWFGPALQRSTAATEVIFLLADYLMTTLGYRRFEWKCDALNQRSRRAAERYGFTYEGTFRQHLVYKGRNRDTAWYSIIDSEWPAIRDAFVAWLDPSNFDDAGRQRRTVESFRNGVVAGG